MRRISACAGAFVFLATASLSAATFEKVRTASGKTIDALPGQIIVRYRTDRTTQGQNKLSAMGAKRRATIPSLNIELLSVPKGQTVESFRALLLNDPNVEFAEPNGILRAFTFPNTPPNDPNFTDQYAIDYNASGTNQSAATINIRPAWQLTTGDADVIVAVVDTGVDQDNADLGNVLAGRQFEIDWLSDGDCTNTPSDQPELGVCNGCAAVGPDQCTSDNPEDDNNINELTGNISTNPTYHGTRVSGIIAADANNGALMAGVAPEVSILPVKVLNSWGFGTFFSIAQGITWAADHGADVINLSLGGQSADSTGSMQAAISHALDNNVVVVAAAGNSGRLTSVNFPASVEGVIAVGSVDSSTALSDFSATGRALDLVAPGEDIYGLVPSTVCVGSFPCGANSNDGTSFAAPEVAGVAALIRTVKPNLSWQQVTQYIDFTATDLGATGYDTNFGFGRLNAGAAVAAANAGTAFVSNPADPGATFPYPNPFRPGNGRIVTISLPSSLGSEGIKIDIMNLAGEKVRTLSGTNSWDGRSDDGDTVAAGLYFYFAQTSAGDAKGKLTLIK